MPQFQTLDAPPSFGSQLGQMLGGGISQGLSSFFQQKQQQAQTQQLLQALGIQPQSAPGSADAGLKSSTAGQPSKNTSISSNLTPEKVIAAAILGDKAGAPHLGGALAGLYQGQQQMAAQERKEEGAREKAAEPELLAMENKLEHYNQESMRFDRLDQLFSPDLEAKFPPTFAVGLLTKDGELNPLAQSQLSPEAQESVKLVADNLSGAKDTFGARVTNFDLQAYMKRLPTLLNSAEGRRRVLRDLRIINQLNRMHDEGVLNIIEQKGGPRKISISQAERLYKRENASKINELRKEFVNPENVSFNSLPDPKNYKGRQILDESTGKKLRSNGTEWVPEE